ncbi:MAG: DUF4242 domain-containing protein [Aphanothece sp. CMT-3BRIN-NPC111]|jgi:hypothetical protein|nr:DUF4242 domain-containing protein [Aphanothece sp. CMT-3BRIN-NPC111]
MTLIVKESSYDPPLTEAEMQEADERALPCLQERGVEWCFSWLGCDRSRMICIFEAPDAESVRESLRKAKVQFERIWAAEIRKPEAPAPIENDSTTLAVVEGTYPPLTEDDWNAGHNLILPCYQERGVQWIRSLVSLDRRRTICEVQTPDPEAICESYSRTGIPFERVWTAEILQP